jgi:hypothetical protein
MQRLDIGNTQEGHKPLCLVNGIGRTASNGKFKAP